MKISSPIIILPLLFVLIVVVFLFLFLSAKMPNQNNNGFVRTWLPDYVSPLDTQKMDFPIKHISGATIGQLYFSGNDPRWVVVTSHSLDVVDTLLFAIEQTPSLSAPNITIDSPNVYMYASSISFFIAGRTDTSFLDTLRLLTPQFTRFAQMSPDKLLIRGLDSTLTKQVFSQIDCQTGRILKQAEIIASQSDGGFGADGYLRFDPASQYAFFVQTFQNRFFCIDSNLNIKYTGSTIDTLSTNSAAIEVVKQKDKIKLMSTTPRQMVNKDCFVGNGFLFVVSSLRADNESLKDYNKHTTVDLYKITDGQYFGSFFIPNLDNGKAIEMKVFNDLLVVLYPKGRVATFQLNIN